MTCGACGVTLTQPHRGRRRWCSESCRVWRHRHPGTERRPTRTPKPKLEPTPAAIRACAECGAAFTTRRDLTRHRFCGSTCRKVAESRRWRERYPDQVQAAKARPAYRDAARRRDERLAATETEPIDDIKVFERDRWICQLCGEPVDQELRWPDARSRSLDHVIPVARGGTHTYGNVQLAHLGCNVSKGAKLTTEAA